MNIRLWDLKSKSQKELIEIIQAFADKGFEKVMEEYYDDKYVKELRWEAKSFIQSMDGEIKKIFENNRKNMKKVLIKAVEREALRWAEGVGNQIMEEI